MTEILVFVGGAALGSLATLIWFGKKKPQPQPLPNDQPQSAYMQTQYANFFNYDGTSNGQLPLE